MFSKKSTGKSIRSFSEKIERIRKLLEDADSVIVGAGSGLSTSAGFTYAGERFEKYFWDFEDKYGFHDMYSGGFYPFPNAEEKWAYWSRYTWVNRYMGTPGKVYSDLLNLIKGKDYFVITTNVDHCFQKAGFDKHRLFYTQGDYGLFQCSEPCHEKTYENEDIIEEMVRFQGFRIEANGELALPENVFPAMTIPQSLVPKCPKCGKEMSMNLRADETFVEDEGWHEAAMRYSDFLRRHEGMKVLYLELGVGYNTPSIIKFDFWNRTDKNPNAFYVCLNKGEAAAPVEIEKRSVCINGDIGDTLEALIDSSL